MADLYGNTTPPPATDGLADNIAGGLAYVTFIPAIIFLLVAPYNRREFVRFHCFQSIFLAIVSFVVGLFRFLGAPGMILAGILNLLIFVVWLIAIIQAFRGKRFLIPGIGPLAQGYAGRL